MLIELAVCGFWGSVAAHERYRCSPYFGNDPGFSGSATVAAHPVLGYKNARVKRGHLRTRTVDRRGEGLRRFLLSSGLPILGRWAFLLGVVKFRCL
ncbi:hypothetical protein FRC0104_02378 [Corynebacterium diphtheriae]|nr:hypothetical protein FRC0104_02378 [Corynebacterium diphtheriae]